MLLCVFCGSNVNINERQCRTCGGQKFISPPNIEHTTEVEKTEICEGNDVTEDVTEGYQQREAGEKTSLKALIPGEAISARYKIIEYIKSGGMGAVYKAQDLRLSRVCAIKELINISLDPEDREDAVKRFEREARILSELKHPNLPRVTDYFTLNDRYYLAMDYIDGEDLGSIIQKRGKKGLPEEEVTEWILQICDVLDYLHSRNPPIIYRDIKPSNIMLRAQDKKIMLIDFGIARTIAPPGQESVTNTMVGTVGYMAPEQFKGKAKTASDIYSLGATMYHLLTGRKPLPLCIEPVETIRPDISPRINAVIAKAVKMMVQQRFASIKDMRAAIRGDIELEAAEKDDAKDIDLLLKQLESPDPNVRYIVIKALANYINNQKTVNILTEIVEKEADTILRRESAKILSQSEDRNILRIFNILLFDNDKEISYTAIKVLKKFKDPSSSDYLIKALTDCRTDTGVEAALCLAEMKEYRASEKILGLMKKEMPPEAQEKLERAINEIDPEFLDNWNKSKNTEEIKKQKKKKINYFIYSIIALFIILLTVKLSFDILRTKKFDRLIGEGKNYFEYFDLDSSAECFKKALDINPESFDANCWLGKVYTFTEREHAKNFLEKAISIKPDNPHGLISLARFYMLEGDFDQSINYLEKAIKIEADLPLAYIYAGEACYRKGDRDRAREFFENSLALPSRNDLTESTAKGWIKRLNSESLSADVRQTVEGNLHQGESFMAQKDYERGAEKFEEIIKVSPEDFRGYLLLGKASLLGKNNVKALENFKQAIECNPVCTEAYCHIASLYIQENNFDRAFETLGKALMIEPDYTEIHYLMGVAYYKVDKKEKGKKEFNLYLKLAPLGEHIEEVKNLLQHGEQ